MKKEDRIFKIMSSIDNIERAKANDNQFDIILNRIAEIENSKNQFAFKFNSLLKYAAAAIILLTCINVFVLIKYNSAKDNLSNNQQYNSQSFVREYSIVR